MFNLFGLEMATEPLQFFCPYALVFILLSANFFINKGCRREPSEQELRQIHDDLVRNGNISRAAEIFPRIHRRRSKPVLEYAIIAIFMSLTFVTFFLVNSITKLHLQLMDAPMWYVLITLVLLLNTRRYIKILLLAKAKDREFIIGGTTVSRINQWGFCLWAVVCWILPCILFNIVFV